MAVEDNKIHHVSRKWNSHFVKNISKTVLLRYSCFFHWQSDAKDENGQNKENNQRPIVVLTRLWYALFGLSVSHPQPSLWFQFQEKQYWTANITEIRAAKPFGKAPLAVRLVNKIALC